MASGKATGFRITAAVRLTILAALAVGTMGCKEDCTPPAKLGDFEFSQGNYTNAVKQYEKALRADPKCYNVEGKLEEARRKAASSN